MQLGDLRTHVLDLVGQDSTVSDDQFGEGFIGRLINQEWQRLYNRISDIAPEEVTKTGTFSTVVDTREYNIRTVNSSAMSDFGKLHLVEKTIPGQTEPFPLVVDRVWQRGRRDVPNRLYLRGTATLGFYDAPASVNTITVHYAPRWTDLTTDTDDPSATATLDPILRDSFDQIVVDRCVGRLLASENGNSIPFFQLAQQAEQEMVGTLRRRRPGPRFMVASQRVTRPGSW